MASYMDESKFLSFKDYPFVSINYFRLCSSIVIDVLKVYYKTEVGTWRFREALKKLMYYRFVKFRTH